MTAVAEFWGRTQIDGPYETLEDSIEALVRREQMFPRLYELMPVDLEGVRVLDYGCGPGHDTVLFAENGALVSYTDISPLARKITFDRLRLHGLSAYGFEVTDATRPALPMADHIHCAGVLHHATNPHLILRAFRDCMNPGAELRVMCYDGELSEHTQSDVPITRWWTPQEVLALAVRAGLSGSHTGSYECSSDWRPNCYAACYMFHAT